MSQSRLGSLTESLANILIGYLIALGAQIVIFPMVGVQASLGQNLTIGAFFTGVSLARSYILRRFFNRWTMRRS